MPSRIGPVGDLLLVVGCILAVAVVAVELVLGDGGLLALGQLLVAVMFEVKRTVAEYVERRGSGQAGGAA